MTLADDFRQEANFWSGWLTLEPDVWERLLARVEQMEAESVRLDADVQHLKLRDPTNECRELLEAAEARVEKMEEALREIADGDTSEHEWRRVARAALERVSS